MGRILDALAYLLIGRDPNAKPAPQKRPSFFTTEIVEGDAVSRPQRFEQIAASIFKAPKVTHASGVGEDSGSVVAMDGGIGKAAFAMNGDNGVPDMIASWYAGQSFIGYQMCALLAQHWLIMKACSMPARDAVRNGWTLTVNDGVKVPTDTISKLERLDKRYHLKTNLTQFVTMGRVFGIRIAFAVVDGIDYEKPFNPDGILPGTYKGISQVDPYWCMPELSAKGASDPTAIGFYEPLFWLIGGKRYHKSHLIIYRGPEVADILKPAYSYGGLSLPQRIYERVYAAERTANEAPQLAMTKRSTTFYTDVEKAISNEGAFVAKLRKWGMWRDNYQIRVAAKDTDLIEQNDTSLADLDAVIMSQYGIVASIADVPLTKLMGTQLKGFSTGEGESDNYHEFVEAVQSNDMERLADRHHVCAIRSDLKTKFTVQTVFNPLDMLDAKEQAEVNKLKAETDKIYVDTGALGNDEVRQRVVKDQDSGHNGLPLVNDELQSPLDIAAAAAAGEEDDEENQADKKPSGLGFAAK